MKILIILINAVLSVEFSVFTCCALDEQEKILFLSVGLEKTQQWGFQNKTTQKSLMEQSSVSTLTLQLGVMLRCKRDEALHGKTNTMETSRC